MTKVIKFFNHEKECFIFFLLQIYFKWNSSRTESTVSPALWKVRFFFKLKSSKSIYSLYQENIGEVEKSLHADEFFWKTMFEADFSVFFLFTLSKCRQMLTTFLFLNETKCDLAQQIFFFHFSLHKLLNISCLRLGFEKF